MLSAALAIAALELPILSSAYTWKFKESPKQCSDLTIQVDGGRPPYSVLIIPSGASPLPNNIEARKISQQNSTGDSSEITFKLNYPKDSQLVAVVSDASGFGSGGTSVAAQVTSSDDDSCFDKGQSVSAPWTFDFEPRAQLVQCQETRIWWDRSKVQGNPNFVGVIPGGKSFSVPSGQVTDRSSDGFGFGFSWTPSIRSGTSVLIVGGDNRGLGSGGSSFVTVGTRSDGSQSCLNDDSPSSTAGDPAGGSYPTSQSGAGVGGSSGSSSNTGAIVGGVIGGVAFLLALILFFLFYRRRKRLNKRHGEKPDLLQADEGDESPNQRNELPQYYQPQPFVVPDPTVGSSSDAGDRLSSDGRRESVVASTDRSGTPDLLGGSQATSRKGGYSRPLRPVNIIQHDDAGPSEGPKEDPETIELPPAYTNIKTQPNAPPVQPAA